MHTLQDLLALEASLKAAAQQTYPASHSRFHGSPTLPPPKKPSRPPRAPWVAATPPTLSLLQLPTPSMLLPLPQTSPGLLTGPHPPARLLYGTRSSSGLPPAQPSAASEERFRAPVTAPGSLRTARTVPPAAMGGTQHGGPAAFASVGSLVWVQPGAGVGLPGERGGTQQGGPSEVLTNGSLLSTQSEAVMGPPAVPHYSPQGSECDGPYVPGANPVPQTPHPCPPGFNRGGLPRCGGSSRALRTQQCHSRPLPAALSRPIPGAQLGRCMPGVSRGLLRTRPPLFPLELTALGPWLVAVVCL